MELPSSEEVDEFITVKPAELENSTSNSSFIYAVNAKRIGRPANSAMIVLFGKTGVGKSSTVNSLFATNVGIKAETGSDSSVTSDVRIYSKFLKAKNAKPPFKAHLKIVDTPGILDTDRAQEPLNYQTILNFATQSSDLKPSKFPFIGLRSKVYPNVILLVIKSGDKRMIGPDSDAAKCMRALDASGLVDRERVNVIIVVTGAGAYMPRFNTKQVYCDSIQKDTENLKTLAKMYLKITVDVVFIENEPQNYMEIEDKSDFYKMPDDKYNMLNLFDAIQNLQLKNHDKIGADLCASYFSNEEPGKNTPMTLLRIFEKPQIANKEAIKCVQMYGELQENDRELFKTIARENTDAKDKKQLTLENTTSTRNNAAEKSFNESSSLWPQIIEAVKEIGIAALGKLFSYFTK